MEDKIKRIIFLKEQQKLLKEEEDKLKEEVFGQLDDKQTMFGYNISKQGKPSYSLKEGIDVVALAQNYPEFIKMDAAKLYKVIDDVDSYIDKKESVSLVFTKAKEKSHKQSKVEKMVIEDINREIQNLDERF